MFYTAESIERLAEHFSQLPESAERPLIDWLFTS